jgi:hypothetical protein
VSSFKIDSGKNILCQELNTGKGYTGFFYLDDKTIRTEICSYDEPFYLAAEKPIFLRTENNRLVSLYSNVSAPPDSNCRIIDPKMESYKQHIISNTAVIGHDRWEETDKLKRVTFLVKRSKDLLRHKEKTDKVARKDWSESNLFSETVDAMTIRAGYDALYSSEFNAPTDISPYLEIEFHTGATLFEYIDRVSCLVEFLSLSLGAHMNPSNIRISRFSSAERTAAIKADGHPEEYAVEYVWPEIAVEDLDPWVGGSLVKAWDDEELAALRECIVLWIGRDADWNKGNVQMMHCLASKQEISADRLLAACKWYEEIPLSKVQAAIKDEDAQIIAETASAKATELGYGKIKNRITGALKAIKTESHEERFSRLLNKVWQKFDPSIIDDGIIMHLKRAIDFRGKSAHGHFNPSDDSEFRAFVKSVYAMEALCFLLTACDLPINANGVKRAHSNPFIRDYRLA